MRLHVRSRAPIFEAITKGVLSQRQAVCEAKGEARRAGRGSERAPGFGRRTRAPPLALSLRCAHETSPRALQRRDEFIECIKNNKAGTLSTEPGALQYTWGESEGEPNTFYFHEEYKDKEGFLAHTKTPHFAAWEKFASSDPFTKPPEVVFFWSSA